MFEGKKVLYSFRETDEGDLKPTSISLGDITLLGAFAVSMEVSKKELSYEKIGTHIHALEKKIALEESRGPDTYKISKAMEHLRTKKILDYTTRNYVVSRLGFTPKAVDILKKLFKVNGLTWKDCYFDRTHLVDTVIPKNRSIQRNVEGNELTAALLGNIKRAVIYKNYLKNKKISLSKTNIKNVYFIKGNTQKDYLEKISEVLKVINPDRNKDLFDFVKQCKHHVQEESWI